MVVGVSGVGKIIFLRLILGVVNGWWEECFRLMIGEIEVFKNVKVFVMIFGEFELSFGIESIFEYVYRKIGDFNVVVEVFNRVGLSDVVFYRVKYLEFSMG